ncbi:Gfo/Idh/MocA family protein [Streptomyces solisilvae]|uniref:Gfo/Idh/MocA family protein n=1 Tax=Streptomyces malaysiensis TaxID=92644 RepID=UPI0036B906F2
MSLHRLVPGPPALRYGLVGPGTHAHEYLLPALSALDGARLTAVAARTLNSAAVAARRWNAAGYTDDWRELVLSGDVDALVVSASPDVHAEVAESALANGVSVFVEKPPAPNTVAMKRLTIAEQKAADAAIAFVGFNYPYGDAYSKLREALAPHGHLRGLDLRMVSSKPTIPASGYGTVMESLLQSLGTHVVDMALRAMGLPDEVNAYRTVINENRVGIRVHLSYVDGRTATLLIGNYSNRLEFRCEFITSSDVVGVLDQLSSVILSQPADVAGGRLLDGKETLRYDWPIRRGGYGRTGYTKELASFQHSVVNHLPSTSPFSACLDVFHVLDEVKNQLKGLS